MLESVLKNSTKDPSPISARRIQLIIGILACAMPTILIIGAKILGDCDIIQSSISAYYHTIMQDFFVGSLCAISLGLVAYNGYHEVDKKVSTLAGILALGVAFFPTSVSPPLTDCILYPIENGVISQIHYGSAALLFLILAFISLVLFTKSDPTKSPRARIRDFIYKASGTMILICVTGILVYSFVFKKTTPDIDDTLRLVFFLEAIAIYAFGIAWLTKSELILGDKE